MIQNYSKQNYFCLILNLVLAEAPNYISHLYILQSYPKSVIFGIEINRLLLFAYLYLSMTVIMRFFIYPSSFFSTCTIQRSNIKSFLIKIKLLKLLLILRRWSVPLCIDSADNVAILLLKINTFIQIVSGFTGISFEQARAWTGNSQFYITFIKLPCPDDDDASS